MSALNNILEQIEAKAAAEAAQVKGAAQQEAEAILAQAEKQAEAARTEVEQQTKRAEKIAEERAKSAADLAHRQALLAARQQLIGKTLQAAHEKLLNLPDDEYFQVLLRLAAKYARDGEGVVYLNEKDLARKPADFEQKLAAAAGEGKKLALSNESRSIDGGLVLGYGGIEENCSFSALFAAEKDALQDTARKLLFD